MSKSSTGAAKRGRRPRKEGRQKKSWLRRTVKWVTIVVVVALVVGAGSLALLYRTTEIPDPNADFLTQTTRVLYADGESALGEFAVQDRESIPLTEMPQVLQDAVVAAEDQSFWTNQGIDPRGIVRAFWNNLRGGSTQGASTITQQYVKILYLTSEPTLRRKAKEALVSVKLQRQQTKSEILEGYLNTIYFGRGAYGVQAAARAYFNRDAADLNLRQSAVLASVLNNPVRFDPANGEENRDALEGRYAYVLDNMVEMGTLDAAEAEVAKERLPVFPEIPANSQYGGQKGHMLKLVRDELGRLGFDEDDIDGGGLTVKTTFTPEAMKAVADGVNAVRPEGMTGPKLHIAAASVEVGTGALLGFYGGHDYLDSQINWAVAGGMAGSTMKAFTNAAAIDAGFSLKDTFEGNSPIELSPTLAFRNQGDADYGSAVSMLTATQNSINTAYIDMVDSMPDGPQRVIDMANALGIPGDEPEEWGIPRNSVDLQPNVGVTLGTAQISPINMANAYATIANLGRRADVHVVDKVTDRDGEVVYSHRSLTRRALDEDIAADVSYSLQQVNSSGTGTAALALGRPSAGKTGTATNADDEVSSSWFVGFTPQIATAVMYVRGSGREQLDGWLPDYNGQGGYFGGNYPARTWTAIMQTLMADLPYESFPAAVWVDGDAPAEGHAPYVPPPPPPPAPPPSATPEPRPTRSPSKGPNAEPADPEPTKPEPTEPEQPSEEPTAEPGP